MTAHKKHILILPRWYPNQTDIQLGIFIKNQAILLKDDFKISVIYVQAIKNQTETFITNTTTKNGIHEQIVYFKQNTSIFKKIINFSRYKKAQQLAYGKLTAKVDLCHVHVPIRPTFLATHLLKTKQIPFVITEHWSGHLTGEFESKSSIYKWYYNKTLKKATKISCVSEFLQHQFENNTGIKPIVTPNYIEYLEDSTIKTTTNKINILTVNDFNNSIKNITGILSAYKKSININPNLHLTLVGGGPDEKLIQNHIKSLNLKPNQITLTGRLKHEKVLDQINQCDFYISFSNFETFGMTIAEALLAGKPVISTLCGGPNEFLNDNNSIIIEKKNNVALESAILKMSTDYVNYIPEKITQPINLKFGKFAVRQKLIELYSI